jgi:hypothetical protein
MTSIEAIEPDAAEAVENRGARGLGELFSPVAVWECGWGQVDSGQAGHLVGSVGDDQRGVSRCGGHQLGGQGLLGVEVRGGFVQ